MYMIVKMTTANVWYDGLKVLTSLALGMVWPDDPSSLTRAGGQ